MSVTAELHDGTRLEFPDGTNPEVVQATVKRVLSERKSKEVSVAGVAAEGGKGLVRGASDVGGMVGKGLANILDPTGFLGAGRAVESLAAPSRELVQANPANEVERFAGTAGELAGGAIAGGGIKAPISTAVGALGGAAGEQVGGETGKVIGSLLPLVAQAGAGLTRLLARGNQKSAAARLTTLEEAGVNPTLADIAPSRANVQAISGKVPIATGITNRAIENQAAQIESRIENLAPPPTSKARVGESIQEGLGTWKNNFYETWRKLDDRVSGLMGQSPVPMTETKGILFKLTTKIDNDDLNAIFTPATLNKIQEAVGKNQALPFDVALQLRREVGKKAAGGFAALKSDVDTGDLKALYGALSRDITAAADTVPGAKSAIEKANRYYAAGSGRIDTYYNRLYKQANPERVFDLLETGTKKGAGEITAVMKAIPQDARDEVISLTLSRMGRAKASTQDAASSVFSPDTFLTKWNQMTPEARKALFAGSSNPEMVSDLDKIAKAISITKESGKALYNPSGTGAVVGYGGSIGALFYAPISTMTGIGSAAAASALMTSPKFVKWLAQSTTISPSAMRSHVGRLAQIASKEGSEFQDAAREYATALENSR